MASRLTRRRVDILDYGDADEAIALRAVLESYAGLRVHRQAIGTPRELVESLNSADAEVEPDRFPRRPS